MKSILVVKQAGMLIPEEHLLKVLHESAPTCFGIACHEKGQDSLLLNHWPALQDIGGNMSEVSKAIVELQESYKDSTILMAFSDQPGKVTADGDGWDTPEMMPFPMLDAEGVVHLILAAQGNFNRWAQKDSETPAIIFAIKDDLLPRIGEFIEESDGDITKLMAKMRKSLSFQKDLKKLADGDDGVFTFFASDGDILTISQNDSTIINNDWGWTTHKSPAAASVPVVKLDQKPKLKLGGLFGGKPKADAAPAPTVPVKDVPQAQPTTPAAPQTETAPAPKVEVVKLKCPPHITDKKAIIKWYVENVGYKPDNFKHKPAVEVRLPLKTFSELKQKMADNGSTTEVKEISSGQFEVKAKEKDVAPHAVKPEMAKPVEKRVAGIIPADQKEKIMKDGVVLKLLGRSSEVINSIEKIKAEEAKIPSFSEQLPKVGLDGLLAATPADYEHLILTYPDAIESILMSYRSMHLKLKDMEKAAQLKEAAKETAPAPAVAVKSKLTLGKLSRAA